MILARILLLTLLIAATPSHGAAPTSVATSPIPEAMITRAIRSDLAYNTPHLEIDLDATKPSAAIDNLLRAKILRVTGKTDGHGLEPKGRLILMLTTAGEGIALRRGWAFGGGLLQIPTGRLSYVPGSYSVQRKNDTAYVTYFWRFEGNSNLAYLLRLGAPSTWPRTMLTGCIVRDGSRNQLPQRREIAIVKDYLGIWGLLERAVINGCTIGK